MEAEEDQPTLGYRLMRQQIIRMDRDRTAEIVAARAEVRQFFQSVREEVESAVAERRPVEYLQTPARHPFVMDGKTPNNFLHYCHQEFLEFFEWGKANDLDLIMMRNQDRKAGFQTWYLVKFRDKFGGIEPEPETEPEPVPNQFRPPRKPVPQAKTKTKKV